MSNDTVENIYYAVDLETTIKCPIGNNKGNAFWPDNFVVMVGVKRYGDVFRYSAKHSRKRLTSIFFIPRYRLTRIIGHNLKFDIHHMRKSGVSIHDVDGKRSVEEWLRTGNVWDTQIAEYLLSGQQEKMAALNDLAPKYGGTAKLDGVKEMWDAGVQTEDMDEDMLHEYLKGDVENTELIALQQMQLAADYGMLPLIESQMDAMLAVQEMEYNGMAIDTELLAELRVMLTIEQHDLRLCIIDALSTIYPQVPRDVWNVGSNKQLSSVLFGGTITWKQKELVGKYKNGKDKYKLVEHSYKLPGMFSAEPEWATKVEGVYSVSDDVLDSLEECSFKDYVVKPIQQLRKVSKELNTYVIGLGELLFPDGLIHHNLNQCLTATGRLSSSNPNLQNIPSNEDSKIKKLFVSRWGKHGRIIEVDYKQLEVIALAFLSRDAQLIDDILNGRDIHYETGRTVFGWKSPKNMTKDSRRIVKTINFGLIYGGSAKALAKQAKTDVSIAKDCIIAFYDRYPGVLEWQEKNIEKVKVARVPGHGHTEKGKPKGTSGLLGPTGRRYVFNEYDAPEWMKDDTSFSPTEIKNYPVQGFATGDIVPLVMGKLWRVLVNDEVLRNKCLMINQVHDALLFDVHEDVLEEAIVTIRKVMENAPAMLKEVFDIDFDLPLKVEVSQGLNWKDQKEV